MENIEGKGPNAGYQHLFLFPQCFPKLCFPELLKVGIEWERVKSPNSSQLERCLLTKHK